MVVYLVQPLVSGLTWRTFSSGLLSTLLIFGAHTRTCGSNVKSRLGGGGRAVTRRRLGRCVDLSPTRPVRPTADYLPVVCQALRRARPSVRPLLRLSSSDIAHVCDVLSTTPIRRRADVWPTLRRGLCSDGGRTSSLWPRIGPGPLSSLYRTCRPLIRSTATRVGSRTI